MMCIACELSFWNMIDALPPEEQERILRAQNARIACDAGEGEPAPQPAADQRKLAVTSRE
jgi:hypothetical protein